MVPVFGNQQAVAAVDGLFAIGETPSRREVTVKSSACTVPDAPAASNKAPQIDNSRVGRNLCRAMERHVDCAEKK